MPCVDPVARAAADYQRAETKLSQARAVLHAAIRKALADGVTQAELVRATGYSRERLRQIAAEQRQD